MEQQPTIVEQRMQFVREFDVIPEAGSRYFRLPTTIVEFDNASGYARLETTGDIDKAEDVAGDDTNISIELQRLAGRLGFAYRVRNLDKVLPDDIAPWAWLKHFEDGYTIAYEPSVYLKKKSRSNASVRAWEGRPSDENRGLVRVIYDCDGLSLALNESVEKHPYIVIPNSPTPPHTFMTSTGGLAFAEMPYGAGFAIRGEDRFSYELERLDDAYVVTIVDRQQFDRTAIVMPHAMSGVGLLQHIRGDDWVETNSRFPVKVHKGLVVS